MKTGDEKDVVVTFPEEYHAEELAGKEATFKTKVNEIKFKDVPELNDEIANELDSDAENVDEYKENLRKRLSEQKATEAENTEKEEAINKATENASIDIPEAMINTELDRMIKNLVKESTTRLRFANILSNLWSKRRATKRPNERRCRTTR